MSGQFDEFNIEDVFALSVGEKAWVRQFAAMSSQIFIAFTDEGFDREEALSLTHQVLDILTSRAQRD